MNNTCFHCSKPTNNPKFCNRSCSAKVTGKIAKKKRSALSSCECGAWKAPNARKCSECTQKKILSKTIGDLIYDNKEFPASKYGRVRLHARTIKKSLAKSCSICGYDKHVEIAHIKSIRDFPLDTPLNVVNSKENLAVFCPNHHWEFDNGMIVVPTSGCAPESAI